MQKETKKEYVLTKETKTIELKENEITPIVLPTVKADYRWINYTGLTGNYKEHKLEDKAEWPTISYAKKLETKRLPKTGF